MVLPALEWVPPIYSGTKDPEESGCSDEPFKGPFSQPLDLIKKNYAGP
jgi:hypothetical protein